MNDMRKTCNMAFATIALMGLITVGASAVRAQHGNPPPTAPGQVTPPALDSQTDKEGTFLSDRSAAFLAIALTMGIACLSAAYAVGKVGAAALGAAAEKPELLNKALPFVGLGEGIAVLGMLISFLIWMKL